MTALSATSPAVSHHFIRAAGGIQIHCRLWQGPAPSGLCVLVHGFLAHSGWWQETAVRLQRFRQIVAVDLSGMGDSNWRPNYSIDQHVAEIAATIRAFTQDKEPVTLVGHSFGGGCCNALVAAHPELVQELVVLDSILRLTPRPYKPAKAFSGRSYASREEALSRFKLIPDQPMVRPEIVERIAAESVRQREDGRWQWKFDGMRPMSSPSANDMWNAALARFLAFRGDKRLMYGEWSELYPAEQVNGLAQRLVGHCRMEMIAEAYHHVLLDQPERLADALNRPTGC